METTKRQQSKQYGLLLIWSSFRLVMHLYESFFFSLSVFDFFDLLRYFDDFSLENVFQCAGVYFLGGINLIIALFVGIAPTQIFHIA